MVQVRILAAEQQVSASPTPSCDIGTGAGGRRPGARSWSRRRLGVGLISGRPERRPNPRAVFVTRMRGAGDHHPRNRHDQRRSEHGARLLIWCRTGRHPGCSADERRATPPPPSRRDERAATSFSLPHERRSAISRIMKPTRRAARPTAVDEPGRSRLTRRDRPGTVVIDQSVAVVPLGELRPIPLFAPQALTDTGSRYASSARRRWSPRGPPQRGCSLPCLASRWCSLRRIPSAPVRRRRRLGRFGRTPVPRAPHATPLFPYQRGPYDGRPRSVTPDRRPK